MFFPSIVHGLRIVQGGNVKDADCIQHAVPYGMGLIRVRDKLDIFEFFTHFHVEENNGKEKF